MNDQPLLPAPSGRVVWTTAAANQFVQFCQRHDPPLAADPTRGRVEEALRLAHPDHDTLIVLGLFVGFRVRADEFIVLLDTGSGTAIAKLGSAGRLRREFEALRSATRIGFDGNQVFLRLRLAPHRAAPIALVYQTAQSRIDLPDTRPLEEVFLSSVLHGSPTPASVAAVVGDLFDALGVECYERSGPRQPVETCWPVLGLEDIRLNPDDTGHCHRLGDSLVAWESGTPAVVRREALAAFPIRRDGSRLIDPVAFFGDVLREVRELARDETAAGRGRLAGLVPRVLVGCGHGDLHGRNVIVGVRNNEAVLPALFDYENMSATNLLAWDFVKLETELKIRAADALWPNTSLRQYAWQLGGLETELGERTERHRRDRNWPVAGGVTPRERLFSLILGVRREAAKWLGQNRPEDWLHEYYFLAAAYGVFSVRYANQSARERTGAFVSAGVAASRFNWSIVNGNGWGRPPARARLVRVWELNRAGRAAGYAEARAAAEELIDSLPHDIHAWYELAFAQLKSGDRPAALETLERVNRLFRGHLDEDLFCLWGRWYKDAGDDARRAAGDPTAPAGDRRAALLAADEHYRRAAEYYARGYDLARDRFPGINLATLYLIRSAVAKTLGRTDAVELRAAADGIATELVESSHRWEARLDDDAVWMPATLAEAFLLRERWAQAADEYRRALSRADGRVEYAAGMKAQVRRVLVAFSEFGITPPSPFDDLNAFFSIPSQPPEA